MAEFPIKVMLADDHPLLRAGVAAVINAEDDMRLVAEADDGVGAVSMFQAHPVDVVVMDLQMPGGGGERAIRAMLEMDPGARIIVLTTLRGDAQAMRLLKLGVSGYLLKSMVRKELLRAIRQVHEGGRYVPDELGGIIARHMADDTLSMRETAVLVQIAQGRSNKEVAEALHIAPETAKSHVRHVMAKLGAKDRAHAVVLALRRGIFSLEDSDASPPGRSR